jgi:hypothetical protein
LQHYSAKAGPIRAAADAAQFFARYRETGKPLLVMALHPRCPCSDASLAELGDLLARSQGKCQALVLQYHPGEDFAGWDAAPVARQLGGVDVKTIIDRDGQLVAALGAATSGHVVFADARGILRFSGGITVARGHRGRSPAQDAILAILAGDSPALTSAPVYGCTLEPVCSAPLPPG